MNKQKYFDLHIEVGMAQQGLFYAKTVLGQAIEYREEGPTPAVAVGKLAVSLETQSLWSNMAQNPQMCSYPFPGPQTPLAATIDPKAPKKRPADLSQVSHPACQMQCTSFDHFSTTKCKSMCGQRSGL